jgi:hypothetical protein
MAGKKPKPKAGRPPEPIPLKSLISLKGSVDFEAWVDGLVEHAHQGTRTLLLKNALREFAENHKYDKPQPKR